MSTLIEIKNLSKHFAVNRKLFGAKKETVKAVDDISFKIEKGETFGLVGESGCGKSTLGRTIIRMLEPTEGQIIYDGTDITNIKGKELKNIHKRMQIIFQDPYSALDPHMTVKEIMSENISMLGKKTEEEQEEIIVSLLNKVGLTASDMYKYPNEFSGGQRQRIGIARALAVNPEFILCDEPISALDVSIQAQVVNLLSDLQNEFGLTYLFIAHDLNMVRHISDKIGVMYLGKMVEIGDSDEVYFNPKHPYTKALLESVPGIEPENILDLDRDIIDGDIPSPLDIPRGCRFHTRCPYATERCKTEQPELYDYKDNHKVACFNCL
ncbi:oligopeptide transport system ATP-binding protein [Pseudobutyrivibrio sp. 49]|uniref:ABC transporter ATP-binding protein n=1 Tax=unclassified Pseudobutyrivibrio TaxID=2638619 RepID=UPI00088C524E|nr:MULTISPECIES: ABC transporter ATP-binding protein [unclassified Pseudobutyrivibrio]SDI49513.1 oligopeptide transport system ATP-binding protein [Pseudobutyrivibrio sp. 49]SFO23089.1 oligopeptide transport system ATP-binding protein [Pseudobutyrivibrio sp. UC1225]